MGESTTGPAVDDIALRFARQLRTRFRVSKILLFGSRARGDHLQESDYDFLIVSDHFEGIPFGQRMALLQECWEGKVAVEPLGYTAQEYERLRRQITIVGEADREGVEL